MLLAEAREDQVDLIKHGLDLFCKASGQRVSFAKSQVFFSLNVSTVMAQWLSGRLGIPPTDALGKYLGCHLLHKGRSNALSRDIIQKSEAKLSGWKLRCLSKAGRITLASSVLSSLPVFHMQIVKLPEQDFKILDKLVRRCIWGEHGGERKFHTISWDTICRPRVKGGLSL